MKSKKPLVLQLDDAFVLMHNMQDQITKQLKYVTEKDGGWPAEEWLQAGGCGGAMMFADADGRVIRSEMIGNPTVSWYEDTIAIATDKCNSVLQTGDATVYHIDEGNLMYAGGIPIRYICPHDGTEKIGALAFSGWPQYADHTAMVVVAFHARMDFDKNLLLDAVSDQATAQAVLDVERTNFIAPSSS